MTVDVHEDDVLLRRLASLEVTGPDPQRVAQRALAAMSTAGRPRGFSRLRLVLLAVPMTVILLLLTSYYLPVVGSALADAPVVRSALKLIGLSRLAPSITGIDSSSTSGGVTLRLAGGYADAAGTILLLQHQPAGQLDLDRTMLRDQFGRTYAVRHVATDLDRAESVLIFAPLSGPAASFGARLTLEIGAVKVGPIPSQLTNREGRWVLTGVLALGQARDIYRPATITIDGVAFEFTAVRSLPAGLQLTMRVTGIDPTTLGERLPDEGKGRPRFQLSILDSRGDTLSPWLVQISSVGASGEITAFWVIPGGDATQLRVELADRGAAQVPLAQR